MASNIAIITRALRDLGVIAEIDTPSPEQGAECLSALNALMPTLEVDGINLGYFAQSLTSADCPIPDYAEKGITAALALDVAPIYGAEPSLALGKKYDEGMATIKRVAMNQKLTGADMSHLPGGVWRWNIDTDS